MDERQYYETQSTLIVLAQIVDGLDLAGFLQCIERAETVGPVADPTLYVRAMGKLGDVKRLAEAAKTFQDEVKRQMGEGDAQAQGG
jgi:hypothetical protein